jgi:hypothetical protein
MMIDVLDRYARENGYVVILDSSAQNTPILYASNQNDVTQDIIRLLRPGLPVEGWLSDAETCFPARGPVHYSQAGSGCISTASR